MFQVKYSCFSGHYSDTFSFDTRRQALEFIKEQGDKSNVETVIRVRNRFRIITRSGGANIVLTKCKAKA